MNIHATSPSSGASSHTTSSSDTHQTSGSSTAGATNSAADASTADTSSSSSSEIKEGLNDLILEFGQQILSQGRQAAADAKADDDDS